MVRWLSSISRHVFQISSDFSYQSVNRRHMRPHQRFVSKIHHMVIYHKDIIDRKTRYHGGLCIRRALGDHPIIRILSSTATSPIASFFCGGILPYGSQKLQSPDTRNPQTHSRSITVSSKSLQRPHKITDHIRVLLRKPHGIHQHATTCLRFQKDPLEMKPMQCLIVVLIIVIPGHIQLWI